MQQGRESELIATGVRSLHVLGGARVASYAAG